MRGGRQGEALWGHTEGATCSKKTPTLTSVRCAGSAVALNGSCFNLELRLGADGRETKSLKTYAERLS